TPLVSALHEGEAVDVEPFDLRRSRGEERRHLGSFGPAFHARQGQMGNEWTTFAQEPLHRELVLEHRGEPRELRGSLTRADPQGVRAPFVGEDAEILKLDVERGGAARCGATRAKSGR